MADVQQPGSPAPQAQPAATPSPTGLEKVYADHGIEDTAETFQPQSPPPAQQPPQPQTPKFDPFDPNFPAHLERISRAATESQNALSKTEQKLNALERQLHAKSVEADIKQAVGTLTEGTDIKPKVAEVVLEAKAREDARFLKIWNNRAQNPKAFQAALAALRGEMESEYAVRRDPQLTENQRAVRVSQQQMATTQKTSENDKWGTMSPEERRQETQRIRRMG
jgi:hypothetical protein